MLHRIGEHARQLGRLQRRLQQRLPEVLADEWQLAGIDERQLVMVASSPVWASQLRFHQRLLIEETAALTGVRPSRCRISVDPPRLQPSRPPARSVGAGASGHVQAFARHQPAGPLRDALDRLAGHLAERNGEEAD